MRKQALLRRVSLAALVSCHGVAAAQTTPAAPALQMTPPALDADTTTATNAVQDTPAGEGSTPSASNQLSDIVVTAQRRAENVQRVPVAISVFTPGELRDRQVTSVSQLSNLAPNVTLTAGSGFSGSSAVLSAFVRGIGSDDFAFNIDPGVGIYLDGVYLARTVGANQDLPDVERIEILKGPQGTLFGRNTIGGAISIVTRDPGDHLAIRGSVTTGSYRLLQANAVMDVPITDDLRSSVTFNVKTREGYLRRIPFADQRVVNSPSSAAFASVGFDPSAREGGDNDFTLRGKLKWANGGPFKATLTGDLTRQDTTGIANSILKTTSDLSGPLAGSSHLPGTAFDPTSTTGFLFAGLYNFCIGATPTQIAARNAQALCGVAGTQFRPELRLPIISSVNVDGNAFNDRLPYDDRFLTGNPDTSYATGNSFSKLTSWGAAGTLELALMPSMTVKSITAYRRLSWQSGLDADGSPLNIVQVSFDQHQHQFSQELQLLGSALSDKFKYVVGGYYFNEGGTQHDYVTFDEGLVQIDGLNRFKTDNFAFFGQTDLRASQLIGITIGARYTRETKRFEGGQQDLNGVNYKLFGCADAQGNIFPNGPFPLAPVGCQAGLGYPNPANPLQVYPPGENRRSFSNFSPKAGIQLYPSDLMMAYGSWSRGYKTGGWTTRLTNPLPVAPTFDPEKAETFEVGVKSRLFDRHLQLNVAAFTTSYKGIQLNFQEGTAPTLRNAGNARIKGFEVEAVAAPADGLTVNATVGYTDAYYTSLLPGVLVAGGPSDLQAGTVIGAPLPKTPKWKLNINPRYVAQLSSGASLSFSIDWTHATEVWNDAQRTYVLRQPVTDTVNGMIGFKPAGGRFGISAGITNLTDQRYVTTGNSSSAGGAIYGVYNRPREFYGRLDFNF